MEKLLEKWKKLVDAAKAYYIDSEPTGLSDAEYDELERKANEEDGFSVRDYIFDTYFPKGSRAKNQYIEKFKKEKVLGKMIDSMKTFGPDYYYLPKYDGTSLAIYIDPKTGKPKQVITCGNTSLGYGIDQTWKILGLGFLPKSFPRGIVAVQCEALIDISRLPGDIDPDRARQKVNGLINGKKEDVIDEVKNLLTLRAYRYYCDDSPSGIAISGVDYMEVIKSFSTVRDEVDGHIKFAPADVYTLPGLESSGDFCEQDRLRTSTGTFLADGFVIYTKKGQVLQALKFAGAGSDTETLIKTTVKYIQWNDQGPKGKDSWSANVIIDPVLVHGSKVTKPTAGSVKKLIENNISPGAKVSIVLANSTIPQVGKCLKPGNGDFNYPVCKCGYQMSEKDVYGSRLKCGNPMCTERLGRMKAYLGTLGNIFDIDLNKYLVIDGFDWSTSGLDLGTLLGYVTTGDYDNFKALLMSKMNTPARKRNLELVLGPAWTVLRESYESK